jgi:hypothetical protein
MATARETEPGHFSDRQFHMKRLEFSISMCIALFFIPAAAYFVVGFCGKADMVNRDAYDILKDTADTTAANQRYSSDFAEQVFLYTWGLGDVTEYRIQRQGDTYAHRLGRDVLFPGVLELILRVKLPASRTAYFSYVRTTAYDCQETACNFWLRARYVGGYLGSEAFFFSIPRNITRPVMQSADPNRDYEVACLQTIRMTFGRFGDVALFWHDRREYAHHSHSDWRAIGPRLTSRRVAAAICCPIRWVTTLSYICAQLITGQTLPYCRGTAQPWNDRTMKSCIAFVCIY